MGLVFIAEFSCVRNMFQASVGSFSPQWTGVGWVWVALVLIEILWDVIPCQLSHNVGDVAVGAQVLQSFMGTTFDALWPNQICCLMSWVLDSRPSNAQLLHDSMQQPLDIGFSHLVCILRAVSRGHGQADQCQQSYLEHDS